MSRDRRRVKSEMAMEEREGAAQRRDLQMDVYVFFGSGFLKDGPSRKCNSGRSIGRRGVRASDVE
jgi:hypothetical protein